MIKKQGQEGSPFDKEFEVTREVRDVNDRAWTLGCSDIGAVYDASTYKSSRDVALAYKGMAPEPTTEQLVAFEWGHDLEPMIAELIKKHYGLKLKESRFRYLCKEEPRLGCHPDRLVIGDPSKAVEIKSSSAFDSARWGEADSDMVPYDYLLQCYGYFICMPKIETVYLFRFSNNRLTRYIISRPENATLKGIVSHLTEWMDKVEKGWMPTPKTFREAIKAWSPKDGTKEAPEQILDIVSDYNACNDEIKKIEEKQDLLKLSIVKYLEEQGVNGLYDGASNKNVCTYTTVERASIDSKMLKEKYPTIAEECTKTTEFSQLKINRPRK